jgi:hypothetical protein
MLMGMTVFDDKVSKPGELITYRSPSTFFSCNEQGVPVTIDLRRLTMPAWWLSMMKLPLSSQDYQLGKVAQFSFGSSSQSPYDTDSHVEITNVKLHRHDYRYIVALAVILVAGWMSFGIWFFRTHARTLAASLNSRLKRICLWSLIAN